MLTPACCFATSSSTPGRSCPQPCHIADERLGGELHLRPARLAQLGEPGDERSEIDAVRLGLERTDGEPSRERIEPLAEGAEAKERAEHAARSDPLHDRMDR